MPGFVCVKIIQPEAGQSFSSLQALFAGPWESTSCFDQLEAPHVLLLTSENEASASADIVDISVLLYPLCQHDTNTYVHLAFNATKVTSLSIKSIFTNVLRLISEV